MRLKEGLVTFTVYKLVVLALALVGVAVWVNIWPLNVGHLISLLFEWDAKHILRVARDGYLAGEPSIQIYPVFPLSVRALHVVLRDWEISAFVAAQAWSFGAFYYFYQLAREQLGEEQGRLALALFAIFPTAYFLTAPYTETAFCATSFAAAYYLRRERWGWAAGAAFLATLSRVNGLMIAPALGLTWLLERGWKDKPRTLRIFGVCAAVVAAYAVYLGMNYSLYGDAFHYVADQQKHWGVRVSWPFSGLFAAFAAWGTRAPSDRMTIIIMEVGFTLAAVAVLPLVWRRCRRFDFFYMAFNLLMLASINFWLSRPRYVLVLYPLFLAVTPWLARSPLRLMLYAFGSAALFGIYWNLYLAAHWAH